MKLPSYILSSLQNSKTSLGQHPSYPPDEEDSFIVSIVSDYFENLSNSFEYDDVNELKGKLSSLITQAKKIESNNVAALEKLCADTVNEIFQIPDNTIKISMKLVDSIDTKDERLVPEKTIDYTFDDIDDMNRLTDEVYKRRMLDSLVTGAAIVNSEEMRYYLQGLFEINDELPSLYKKIFELNNLLLYLEKDTMNKDDITDGGKVDVNIMSPDNMVEIKAEGVLMPVLLEETIKGILELAVSHGLPKNSNKAQYVISKSDFKLAEMWDARLGVPLWRLIINALETQGIDIDNIGANYLLMEISKLPSEKFNSLLREVFKGTKKGKTSLARIVNEINNMKEEEDFITHMDSMNSEYSEIADDEYYSPDELITDSELPIDEASKPLISPEEAEKQGFAVPKEHITWKEGEFQIPKKKEIGYKVFALKNGQLYPPVVANQDGQPTPIGKWLPCGCPPIVGYTAAEHRPQVKTGGDGTARNLGNLSFRPGWHLGMIPFAKQFCYKLNNSETLLVNGRYVFPDDFVFAECEYQADNDLSDECYKNGLTKAGKYQHSRAGIPRIPKNAFYRYRTNVDPSTEDWIITGAVKINKVLTRDEVDAINAKSGIRPLIYANKKQALQLKKQVIAQRKNNVQPQQQIPQQQSFEEGKIYSPSIILEEITQKQLRKAANRNAVEPNSVKINNTSNGELSTVKINKKSNSGKSLSRIVIKGFNNGRYERVRIINGMQDRLVRQYNDIIKRYCNEGFIKIKTKGDTVIGHSCMLLFGTRQPIIKCLFIETDDLSVCERDFDLNNVRQILIKNNVPPSFYGLPDEETEENNTTPSDNARMRDNWSWIENGKPRTYKTR